MNGGLFTQCSSRGRSVKLAAEGHHTGNLAEPSLGASLAATAISRESFVDKDLDVWLNPIADSATESLGGIHSWIRALVGGGSRLLRFPALERGKHQAAPCVCLKISDDLSRTSRDNNARSWDLVDGWSFTTLSPSSSYCELESDRNQGVGILVASKIEYLATTIGVLAVHLPPGHAASSQSLSVLESLAAQAGIIIGTHHLVQRSEERTRELEALNTIAEELSGSLGISAKLDKAIDKVLEVVAADGGMIYLLDRETNFLNLVVRRGIPSFGLGEADQLAPGEGVSSWVIAHQKPVVIFDVAHDERMVVRWMARDGVSCVAVVPIMARGEAFGTLCAFTHEENPRMSEREHLMCAVANQIGIAVENQELADRASAFQAERIGLLRERLFAVTNAQEEARAKLARELHDQVAQGLVSSIVGLRAVSSQLGDGRTAVCDQIKAIGDTLSGTLNRSREIILDLRSTLGEKKTFAEAIRDDLLAKAGNESGALCSFESTNWPDTLAPDVSVNLYRIVQEALQNATRHGKPSHIWLKARCLGRRILEIVITDDGCGFNPPNLDELSPSSGHVGLLGMQERASLMQGKLEVRSSPMAGTIVKVSVPWKWAMSSEENGEESD